MASLAGSLVSAAGLGIYSHWIEPYWLEVTRTRVVIPGLPPALDGLVVAHLSDFHLPEHPDHRDVVTQAIEVVNQVNPDLVVLTGDYLNTRASLRVFDQVLAALNPRPVYAVFGNHDYRFGPTTRRGLERLFAEHDVTLLDNRSIAFKRGEDQVWFVGVGDAYTSHDRLSDALGGLGSSDHPRILLTHYPDFLRDVEPGSFALALAGHTHGAQIDLPVLSERALRQSDTTFSDGLYQANGIPLYVSRGLGTSRWRLRLRARPELAIIILGAEPRPHKGSGAASFDAAGSTPS